MFKTMRCIRPFLWQHLSSSTRTSNAYTCAYRISPKVMCFGTNVTESVAQVMTPSTTRADSEKNTNSRSVTYSSPVVSGGGGVTASQMRLRSERMKGASGEDLEKLQRSYMDVEKEIAEAQREIRDLHRESRYKEAMEIAKSTRTLCIEHFGDEHPVVASMHVNVGLLHRCVGELVEAEIPYVKALKIYRKVCGMDHPSTATCFVNLAALHKARASQLSGMDRLAEVDKSRSYGEEALTLKIDAFGKSHPDVAVAKYTLAMIYLDVGASLYKKALPLLTDSVSILTEKLGDSHRLTATAKNNLGYYYKHTGDFDKGLEYYESALKVREKILGEKHEDTLITLHNISELFLSAGQDDKASIVQERILNTYKKTSEKVSRKDDIPITNTTNKRNNPNSKDTSSDVNVSKNSRWSEEWNSIDKN